MSDKITFVDCENGFSVEKLSPGGGFYINDEDGDTTLYYARDLEELRGWLQKVWATAVMLDGGGSISNPLTSVENRCFDHGLAPGDPIIHRHAEAIAGLHKRVEALEKSIQAAKQCWSNLV